MTHQSSWLLCWVDPFKLEHWDIFPSADALASHLVEITEGYNACLEPGEERFGVMDFTDTTVVVDLSGPARIALEDVPSYCSDEWLKANSSSLLAKEAT